MCSAGKVCCLNFMLKDETIGIINIFYVDTFVIFHLIFSLAHFFQSLDVCLSCALPSFAARFP